MVKGRSKQGLIRILINSGGIHHCTFESPDSEVEESAKFSEKDLAVWSEACTKLFGEETEPDIATLL